MARLAKMLADEKRRKEAQQFQVSPPNLGPMMEKVIPSHQAQIEKD